MSNRNAHSIQSSKVRHNKVATPSQRTTGWPTNKLPRQKVRREGEAAISNRAAMSVRRLAISLTVYFVS